MKKFNEYYHPTIEEFHVGFEYERNDGGDWYKKTCDAYDLMDVKTMLNKHILVDGSAMLYYLHKPEQLDVRMKIGTLPNIRVKHLDYDYLEEYGFEKTDKTCPYVGTPFFVLNTEVGFNTGKNIYMSRYSDTGWTYKYDWYGSYSSGESIPMQIEIRNKSEFRKLMMQLRKNGA
jgi:hypothetical protein